MGTTGIAVAFFISYFVVFLIQLLVIKHIEEAKELNKVGFFSMETVEDLKAYMKIALPNVLSMIIEFATFDVMIVMMGIVGVVSQASMIIFMNISTQVFAIYFGLSIAVSTLVG